jgi:hypothetical protein
MCVYLPYCDNYCLSLVFVNIPNISSKAWISLMTSDQLNQINYCNKLNYTNLIFNY